MVIKKEMEISSFNNVLYNLSILLASKVVLAYSVDGARINGALDKKLKLSALPPFHKKIL